MVAKKVIPMVLLAEQRAGFYLVLTFEMRWKG